MKEILIAIISLLLANFAQAQLTEIKSPDSSVTLNDVIVWQNNPSDFPNLIVVGNGGYAAYSDDGAKSWSRITVDSQSRNIKVIRRLKSNLFVASGGLDNNICKYSTDGKNWKDINIPDKKPVLNFFLQNDGKLGIVFQDYVVLGDVAGSSFVREDYPEGFKCSGSNTEGNLVVSFWGNDGTYDTFYSMSLVVYLFKNTNLGKKFYTLGSILNGGTFNSHTLAYFISTEKEKKVLWKTPTTGVSTVTVYNFSEGTDIKSGCMNYSNPYQGITGDRFQVGGKSGESAFIIKNEQIVQNFSGFCFNSIKRCEMETDATFSRVIAVGEKGKIYSNHSDLAPAVVSPITTSYFVSDPTTVVGREVTVEVSGAQAGVSYEVRREKDSSVVRTFYSSTAVDAWNFRFTPEETMNLVVKAILNGTSLDLPDKAVITVTPNYQFTLSDPTIKKGQEATITCSSSEVGMRYQLRYMITKVDIGEPIVSTGGLLFFKVAPTVTTKYNVYITDPSGKLSPVYVNDIATVTVEFSDAVEPELALPNGMYPNPCSAFVNFNAKKAGQATLYDLSGRGLEIFRIQAGQNRLNTSGLKTGVYIIDGQRLIKQ